MLGVGVRVAGRMANERLTGERPGQPVAAQPYPAQPAKPQSSRKPQRPSGSLTRGLGGFFRPFQRVGGAVFLEVTGAFFLLFVLLFGQMAWRMRSSYATGPDHWKFLAAIALALIFVYLSASSFWRARKR